MDESWRELRDYGERLRWARMRAGFERGKDAADSLGMKAVTYRTYERRDGPEARRPPLPVSQQMARKFKVSWTWLVSGDGSPHAPPGRGDLGERVERKIDELPEDKREDALAAMWAVLDAYAKRA
jgi:transcriptional regulator with XRE-family HTH domain